MKKNRILFFCMFIPIFFYSITLNAQTTDSATEEVQSQTEQRTETLLYGLDSEVASLVSTLITEKDNSFSEEILNLFQTARNTTLKDAIINYFTEFEDPALKDFALYLLEDPYDERSSTVNATINYVGKLKISEAGPLLQDIIESDNQSYFQSAMTAIGTIGGPSEAEFLVEYLENDLSIAQRQTLVRALGLLQAVETYDALVEMAQNEDENSYVRMYATEAIGNIKPDESLDILKNLYSSTDPNLREYVVKGIATNTSEEAQNLLLTALKDDYYKVRLAAVEAIKNQNIKNAGAALLYRSKNDSETSVIYACYDAIVALNYETGIDFLISLLEIDKTNDTVKSTIASALLKYDISRGIDAVITLAETTLTDDKKKNLRYALGKEFAKYENNAFESICAKYLASDDVSTQGTGLDIYKTNPYAGLRSTVQSLADSTSVATSIQAKAKTILSN
ncbi:MAG: HEAT repeat domain-containing protein [Spirochaetales bacterium]